MPELAEVEYYRRRWNPGIGHDILNVAIHAQTRVFRGTDVKSWVPTLLGARLVASFAHGKQMLFQFSKNAWVGVHLGMTGELRCEKSGAPVRKHDHLVLEQRGRKLVFADPRQFGRVLFHRGAEPPDWWRRLPPAVLTPDFTAERVEAFLQRRRGSPIKAVLLMQEGFPGIGNWMADEILWRLRLHPALPAGKLVDMAESVWREVRWVSERALEIVAPSFADLPDDWLFPYRWKNGGLCPRDGEVLLRKEIGGRTTAWCPNCQIRQVRPSVRARQKTQLRPTRRDTRKSSRGAKSRPLARFFSPLQRRIR